MAVLAIAASVAADARTDYLVRALRTSPMFRVRAQAAISLGSVQNEPQVTRALTDALGDEHPAVRAAACAAIERQRDPSALPAVRQLASDREAAVRTACATAATSLERAARTQPQRERLPATSETGPEPPRGDDRFYVAVGQPATKVRGIDEGTLASARQIIRATTGQMSGVRLAPDRETPAAAQAVLRDGLAGYYLDTSITSVEQTPQGLRVAVSVVVQSYPDRNIRSMLSGAATVPGGSGPAAERQAIEGALRGALRNLPQAMAASAGAGPSPGGASGGGGRRR
ncbi:MAG: HEAT repeat domain-containing protein [Sandaracinaceae bacterium]|nr:HEAT repeat domain-containing protein [Sandaracinaceae bacterium]